MLFWGFFFLQLFKFLLTGGLLDLSIFSWVYRFIEYSQLHMTSREAEARILRNSNPEQPFVIEKKSQELAQSTLTVSLAFIVLGWDQGMVSC